MNNCTLLLSSCDNYEDTWCPFFTCLKKYWPDFNMKIILNTESKDYSFKGFDIETFNLFKTGEKRWSLRLKENLKKINTEYVLFMLDDFFITKKVDTNFIKTCIKWMNENKNIAVFSLAPCKDSKNIKSEKYKGFEKRNRNGMYRFNCQAAIWRKERLIKFLKDNESPWDWEIYGSIRSRKYKDDFYSLCENVKLPIEYNFGFAICRGKWSKEFIIPLFEKLKININLNKRGLIENYKYIDNRTFIQKCKTKVKKIKAWIESKM